VYADIIIILHAFYKGKGAMKKANILSFGINTLGDVDGLTPGIHAEHDAIRKLPPLRRRNKLENINMLVIRLSTTNKLQMSKPCVNCIQMMNSMPEKLGYKIKNVYYSNSNGNIIKTNLKNLENEETHYSRFYRRKLKIS
jgi:cytidine deaminase